MQHGTAEAIHRSLIFHRYLGTMLILSGIAKSMEVIWQEKHRWVVYHWIVFMLITSVMLITYREPEGAYQETQMEQMD